MSPFSAAAQNGLSVCMSATGMYNKSCGILWVTNSGSESRVACFRFAEVGIMLRDVAEDI